EYLGLNAYMDIGALRRLLGEGEVLSGAFLKVDRSRVDELYRALKEAPRLAGVSLTRVAYEGFLSTLGRSLRLMIGFNLAFAIVIACGVVYNSARVSLSERERDLASLRVLGFTRGEISFILLGELAAVTLVAVPLGFVLGNLMVRALLAVLGTELVRFPNVIQPGSYAIATLVVVAAAAASGLLVRRRLDRLDLVAVLKSRE
ncbi:MAG: ABC transporter permease, partial [Thermoanaerobaculia bacterium]|nr:ABC transporter permease [Thermoanaerobaculia bacterium]